MKKPPAIYGIGWIEAPDATAFTLSFIGSADDPAAVALAAAVGHDGGSGSYSFTGDVTVADGEVGNLLADMIEDEVDIVVVFSTDRSSAGDPKVTLLRDVYESERADVVYGEARWWPTDDAATDPYPMIEQWAKRWPDSLPIAHELKELFEDQWVRLHSLPTSKRAPESEADWEIALSRHNTLLGELASDGVDLLVIMSVVRPAPAPLDRDPDFWTAVPWHYADPDLLFAHLFVTGEQWAPGALDELLKLAIEQQIGGVIIAPLDLEWLYHPYPGGADVIFSAVADRDALASRHRDWRSSHASGL